jgi:endonuclease/exonuclease/phosphatase family metal-dependent hydrolase
LLLFPLYVIATQKTAVATTGNGYPIRVMNYNLHNGFHPYGFLDLEAIAQVIENENADVVALQEVARGWVINGSDDMLIWLSRRLDMAYISGPTADPLWGNALLSRYPIINYELLPLPGDDIPLRRGFIAAEIDLGGGDTLNAIVTHLHHPSDASALRQEQVQAILDYVQDDAQTIIMGDFNATPETPEIVLLRDAGFLDILIGVQPNYTYPSLDPDQQIDYIWLTPDLTAEAIHIPLEPASDHLGVAATIRP